MIIALITILLGAITFALGQFILKAALEPIIELKQLIGRISFDLDFYTDGDDAAGKEACLAYRTHALRLRELLNTIIGLELFRYVTSLPPKSDILEASRKLPGLSASLSEPARSGAKEKESEIRSLLRIQT